MHVHVYYCIIAFITCTYSIHMAYEQRCESLYPEGCAYKWSSFLLVSLIVPQMLVLLDMIKSIQNGSLFLPFHRLSFRRQIHNN